MAYECTSMVSKKHHDFFIYTVKCLQQVRHRSRSERPASYPIDILTIGHSELLRRSTYESILYITSTLVFIMILYIESASGAASGIRRTWIRHVMSFGNEHPYSSEGGFSRNYLIPVQRIYFRDENSVF